MPKKSKEIEIRKAGIRKMYADGWKIALIAEVFECTQAYVSKLGKPVRWKRQSKASYGNMWRQRKASWIRREAKYSGID